MTRTGFRSPSTRLSGARLWLAKAVWLAVTLTTVVLVALLLPQSYRELSTLCVQPPCAGLETHPELAAMLAQLGIPLAARASLVVGSAALLIAAYGGVGVALFVLRPDDWIAMFSSLALITCGATTGVIYPATRLAPPLLLPGLALECFFLASLVVVLCIFPDGRFVPGWTRWLAAAWVIWIGLSYLLPWAPFSVLAMSYGQFLLFRLVWYSAAIVAQIQRFRRIATAEQRQQTKWVLFGVIGALLVFFGLEIPLALAPALGADTPAGVLYGLFRLPLLTVGLILIPLAAAVSILRFRLWDVDVLINRTLVYSLLTAVLALVYFGSVTLAQALFRAITGQESDIAVVVSTLALAALLSPLRARFQHFIDRRFYRRKYNAERVLTSFSVAMRDEIDIERLTPALLSAIEEAVQPAQLSLWQPKHRRER